MTGTATAGDGATRDGGRSQGNGDESEPLRFGSGGRESAAVAALSEIAARMGAIGEVGRIGRLDGARRPAHGDAERIVTGGESEGFRTSEADQQDDDEDDEADTAQAAQLLHPSSLRHDVHGRHSSWTCWSIEEETTMSISRP